MSKAEHSHDAIRALLAEALEGSAAESSIGPNFSVDNDLVEAGIDSLDLVEFYLRVEDRYRIKIPQEQYQNLRSIDAVSAFVGQELSERSA